MKKTILFIATLIFCAGVNAQTNPTPQALPYSQNFSSLAHSSSSYPTGWQGWLLSGSPRDTFKTSAPTVDSPLVASGDASSTTAGIYNYNSKIGFLNDGSLDLGIVLSVSTSGRKTITLSYDVMTIRNPYDPTPPNTRINKVATQYRIGTSGTFTPLDDSSYQNNTTLQIGAVTTPQNLVRNTIVLPTACDNQPVVQLRWVTREVSGAGSRPSFAVDSISVTGTCSDLVLTTSSQSNLIRQCTSGTTIYYGNGTSNYFAIDTSGITAGVLTGDTVSITVGNFDSSKSSNGANQEHAMYLLNRYWNAKGSFTGTVKVQFPYSVSDTVILIGFRDSAYKQLTTVTNTSSFAKKNAKLEWFKTVGTNYGPSVISGIVGNKFPTSAGIIKPKFSYDVSGSTSYVLLDSITSFFGGSAGFSFGPNNGTGGNGLPVTWVSIDAGHTETGNRVDWSTASEKNNDYFLVESSSDAITWKVESSKIEPKDTTGNNASLSEYNWTHLGNNEKMYYRIKQVDFDGKYDYSKVAYANKSAKAPAGILSTETEPYLIYPNPASGSVTIAGYANTDVTIMDNVGRIVLHHRMSQTKQVLDISILAPGIYSVGLADLQRNNIVKKLIIE